jgi:dTDP-4-dehydrorhamnose 3,5-epimerase
MKSIATSLPGVLILEPRVFADDRGFFLESYNEKIFADLGIREDFVQDNHSFSKQNVVRGLHYQAAHPQGKLVRTVAGKIFDVAVDLRRGSSTFGRWHGEILSEENKRMLWIPAGFAHGFSVLAQSTQVLYKATDFYHPESERTIVWNDSRLGIDWRLKGEARVSAKDQLGIPFCDAETFE